MAQNLKTTIRTCNLISLLQLKWAQTPNCYQLQILRRWSLLDALIKGGHRTGVVYYFFFQRVQFQKII